MDDFKLLSRDFHIDESFEDEGGRFPQLKEIMRANSGIQRNSMHERTKSQDYIMMEATMPKYTRQKTS